MIGLAVLCNPANTEEIIQVAFKVLSAPLEASRCASKTSVDSKCIIRTSVNPLPEFIDLPWQVHEGNVIMTMATEKKQNTNISLSKN